MVTKQLTVEQTNRALARKRIKSKVGKIAALAFVYFMLLLIYAPLIYVTIYSFTDASATGVWAGFSVKTYEFLFNAENVKSMEIWRAVGNTLLVAATAAAISTVLGTLGAIGIYYTRKKWWKNTLEFVNQIPVVNAEIVTAVSLCVLFVLITKTLNIERNFFTLVIGHVVLSIPYVVLSVLPKLQQMDPAHYESAMDLGATQTQALIKVVIPDIVPGILSGFMLSITLSLDDYVITAFTKPDSMIIGEEEYEFQTLSTYVDSAIKKKGLPIQLRAFTAILFGIILIVMIAMNVKSSLDAKKLSKNVKE